MGGIDYVARAEMQAERSVRYHAAMMRKAAREKFAAARYELKINNNVGAAILIAEAQALDLAALAADDVAQSFVIGARPQELIEKGNPIQKKGGACQAPKP